ncbi:MAG TPA: hypothetical protein VHV49_05425 [Pseudonocardiaceae bacterium]|jgi:hypothetical protein|nr:hypothetical protein [Pseudonocardiaceae bacterium]
MADNMTEHDIRTGSPDWDRLMAEGSRLQALYQQGRLDDVLAGVETCRATMATLDDPPATERTVAAWSIREGLLGMGVAAAHGLGHWSEALEFNAAVLRSQKDRRAEEVEQAVTWFNDYGPLLHLGRPRDARDLLYRCRGVFGRAENVMMMGNTLSALADTDARLGNVELAVQQETDALRMKYRGTDPEAIAVSHYNLANHLVRVGTDLRSMWAHRLAAAVIRYQIGSPRLGTSIQSIGRLIGEHQADELLQVQSPLSFNDVCQKVDALDGVRFTELFGFLPSRAETGPAAVDAVMRLTDETRGSVFQESVAAWEPVISAMVAAARPDADEAVSGLLDEALDELKQQQPWRELVAVLRRVQAGPDHHSANTIADLDPVSAAVAGRAIAALTGEVTVDPTAWRALTEEG